LKRVVVAYQNRVVMDETLDAALARLFGEAAVPAGAVAAAPAASAPDAGTGELVRRALELYQNAIAAQRGGDWARYGAELNRLGEVLRQLQATSEGRER
jgi:uncharacterized membrane protein (UPF0182 family)